MISPPAHPFHILRVRSLLFWFILFSLGISVGLKIIANALDWRLEDPIWILVNYLLLFSGLNLWLVRQFQQRRFSLKPLIGSLPERPHWLLMLGLVVAMLLFSLGSFEVVFYPLTFIAPSFVQSVLNELADTAAPITVAPDLYKLLNAIASLIIAPLTEEFIFRGFILQRWAVKWNLPLALILSSILFGILHPNPIGLSVFGLIMGLLYIKTRSLLVPIICHFLNNAVVTVMELLPDLSNANPISTLEDLRAGLGMSILLMVISLPWLIQFIRKTFPRRDAPIPYLLNRA